jgi:hypothetical protein
VQRVGLLLICLIGTGNADLSEAADCNGMPGYLKGDHQYVALGRLEFVRWADFPSTEKTLITKEKKKMY